MDKHVSKSAETFGVDKWEIVSAQTHTNSMASFAQLVKRALVSVLLELARIYALDLNLNRDSSDTDVKKAFRRVVLKVHPDISQAELH